MDMLEEMKSQMKLVMDMTEEFIPQFAKIYSKLYLSLIEEGFSEENAMRIVSNYKPTTGGN